ncbi:MAG TPA: hypothetical protein VGC90_06860 [Candidatus Limnocylindrales bacterium]|jgi:hypothetical protein
MSEAVRVVVILLILVAFLASRPLEIWLWRTGRIPDRIAALLLVGRLPLFVAVIALVSTASWPAALFAVAVAALAPFLLYRRTLRFLDDEAARRGLRDRRRP